MSDSVTDVVTGAVTGVVPARLPARWGRSAPSRSRLGGYADAWLCGRSTTASVQRLIAVWAAVSDAAPVCEAAAAVSVVAALLGRSRADGGRFRRAWREKSTRGRGRRRRRRDPHRPNHTLLALMAARNPTGPGSKWRRSWQSRGRRRRPRRARASLPLCRDGRGSAPTRDYQQSSYSDLMAGQVLLRSPNGRY